MLGAVLWIFCFHTSKCRFALSPALNAKGGLSNTRLFAGRAQRGEGIIVLGAEAQLLPQLDLLEVTRSQEKGAAGHKHCPGVEVKDVEPPLPWLWTYHAFSLREGNLNLSYTFPLPASHQSWHPMQTAFRNRVWDTRDAVHVVFIIVNPIYRKAHLEAVHRFQKI